MARTNLLYLSFAVLLASTVLAEATRNDNLQKRDADDNDGLETLKILSRERNGHACIMSIVFIVLYPLGAISIHLPIASIPGLRNTYLVHKVPAIHVPIQILGLVMMIGGMGLGIKIASTLGYLDTPKHVQAHIVIGLLVPCIIILFQPLLGMLQHRFFKKTGKTSVFGIAHRWIGRGAIILGIINDGLGLQLAKNDIIVPKSTYVRNFVIAGVLFLIWVGVAVWDNFRSQPPKMVEKKGEKIVDNGVMTDA